MFYLNNLSYHYINRSHAKPFHPSFNLMEMPGGQDNVPSVTCPVRHKFISQKHCITNQEILLINNIIETDYVCNIFHGLGNIFIHFIDKKI